MIIKTIDVEVSLSHNFNSIKCRMSADLELQEEFKQAKKTLYNECLKFVSAKILTLESDSKKIQTKAKELIAEKQKPKPLPDLF